MKLFLTQAFIDYELAFKRGFRDSYRWHQGVWEAFPNDGKAERNFLTRLDARDQGFQLLLLSQCEPVRPDWAPSHEWKTKAIDDEFLSHDRYAFQLRANPTRKLRVDLPDGTRKKNGRRQALTTREDLEAWFQRKAEAAGFRSDTSALRIHSSRKETFVKQRPDAGRFLGVLQGVEFRGTLEVIDREAFSRAFARGIGPAKAFGYGLIALAPLNHPTV